jgi:hypothetical protein
MLAWPARAYLPFFRAYTLNYNQSTNLLYTPFEFPHGTSTSRHIYLSIVSATVLQYVIVIAIVECAQPIRRLSSEDLGFPFIPSIVIDIDIPF